MASPIPRPQLSCELPPRPRRPPRRATDPRRRRYLDGNQIIGPIPTEIGLLKALNILRVPPASLTPGAARDRSSASQGPLRQPAGGPDPARDRPAHGAAVRASSPRVPDARRAARPPLDVAGSSTTTRSTARSRLRSPSSRRCRCCELPRVPDARRAARPPLDVAGTSRTTRSPAHSQSKPASSRSQFRVGYSADSKPATPASSRRAMAAATYRRPGKPARRRPRPRRRICRTTGG